MPDALELLNSLGSDGLPKPPEPPPIAPPTGIERIDKLNATIGRPEWFDQSRPVADRARSVAETTAAAGMDFSAAEGHLRRLGVDPKAVEPQFKLASARQRASAMEEPLGHMVVEAADVLGIAGAALEREYGRASRRIAEGKGRAKGEDGAATDDYDLVAQYERLRQIKADEGLGGELARAVRKAPGFLLGFGAANRVIGVGARALGVGAAVPEGATLGRAVAGVAGRSLATAPLLPGMYAEAAAANATQAGGEPWDLKNAAPAVAVAALNVAVLGQIQARAGGVENAVKRVAAQAGLGVGEQAAADVVAGGLGLQAGYGTLGELAEGKYGAAFQHATVQALTFGAFAAVHGRKPTELLDKFKDAAVDLKEKGFSPDEAARWLKLPDLGPETEPGGENWKAFVDSLPKGPAREYAEAAGAGLGARVPQVEAGVEPPSEPPRPKADPFEFVTEAVAKEVAGKLGFSKAGKREAVIARVAESPVGRMMLANASNARRPAPPAGEPVVQARTSEGDEPPSSQRYWRVPNTKAGGSNFGAAIDELTGSMFSGKFTNRTREGNASYFEPGRVQLEFARSGFTPAELKEFVSHTGSNEATLGGRAPMWAHPSLKVIRFRGSEASAEFKELRERVDGKDGWNERRREAGVAPIRLEPVQSEPVGTGRPVDRLRPVRPEPPPEAVATLREWLKAIEAGVPTMVPRRIEKAGEALGVKYEGKDTPQDYAEKVRVAMAPKTEGGVAPGGARSPEPAPPATRVATAESSTRPAFTPPAPPRLGPEEAAARRAALLARSQQAQPGRVATPRPQPLSRPEPAAADAHERLASVMRAVSLQPAEQHVVLSYFAGRPLGEIGADTQIGGRRADPLTRQRVAQIKDAALAKLGIDKKTEQELLDEMRRAGREALPEAGEGTEKPGPVRKAPVEVRVQREYDDAVDALIPEIEHAIQSGADPAEVWDRALEADPSLLGARRGDRAGEGGPAEARGGQGGTGDQGPAGQAQAAHAAAHVGKATTIAVAGARPLAARYEVRDLAGVRASHQAVAPENLRDRQKAGEYPEGLQPRDYAVAGERNKVWDNARQLEPRYLISSHPDATSGPPAIAEDGTVLNGNGRQMTLEAAKVAGSYPRYKAELVARAAEFGLDPAAVDKMDSPALYRVVGLDPASPEAREFARRGNVTTTQAQSPARTAAALADLVDERTLASLKLTGDETFSQAVNHPTAGRPFRDRLYDQIPPTLRDTYFEPGRERLLTDAGKELVEQILLSKIIPVRLAEALGRERKQVLRAVEGAVPQVLALRVKFHDTDPTPQLVEALEFLARNDRVTSLADAANALDQLDLFSGRPAESMSPGGRMMLDFVLENAGKVRQFREKLAAMVRGEDASRGRLFEVASFGGNADPAENAAANLGVKFRPGAVFGPVDPGAINGALAKLEREASGVVETAIRAGQGRAAAQAVVSSGLPHGAAAEEAANGRARGAAGLGGPAEGEPGSGPGVRPGQPAGLGESGAGAAERGGRERPLSDEERAGGQLGGGQEDAAGAKPPAREESKTALANARVDAERQERGLPPLLKDARLEDAAVWDRAMDLVDADPEAAARLVEDLERNPRPTSDVENALLLQRKVTLRNRYDRAQAALLDPELAKRRFTPEGKAEQETRWRAVDDLEAAVNRLDEVTRATGREWGRAGRWRRILVAEDYSLAGMIGRATRAKGEPLSEMERSTIARQAEEIKRADARLAALEAAAGGPAGLGPRGGPGDLAAARIGVRRARVDFANTLAELRTAALPLHRRVFGRAVDVANAARSLITAFDFSAVLRQGALLTFAHPVKAARAIPDMLRAARSEEAFDRQQDALDQRANAHLYQEAGLFLAETDNLLSRAEEAFASKLARKVPGVKASERAYTSYLNRLRADVFDSMTASLARSGRPTIDEAKAVANYVNVATGRGSLGGFEKAGTALATVFFSPRYVASRFQLLAGQPLWGGTPATRKAVAEEYARAAAGLAVFYALAALANEDAKIRFDPRSSDFGKVVVGKTRIDPLAGLSQIVVLGARAASGETKGPLPSEKLTPIRGPRVPYGGMTVQDAAANFVRGKLAPLPGVAADVATGQSVVGERATLKREAGQILLPISFRDVYDALQDQGIPRGVGVGMLAILGMGTQLHDRGARR